MKNKTIGIITIHKIHNFGSVLQTYALWKTVQERGYNVEIINYKFPNEYHISASSEKTTKEIKYPKATFQEKIMKVVYGRDLIRQHRLTDTFLNRMNVLLSKEAYLNRQQLLSNPPQYDVYISGSDQIWNPRYTKGDDIFLLSFAPESSLRISYASSFGVDNLSDSVCIEYAKFFDQYNSISVREENGVRILRESFSKDSVCVLDPTLLLNAQQWRSVLKINTSQNVDPYIFCYFLNYSFDAFPYAEEFALHLKKKTGLRLIFGGRPPKRINTKGIEYRVGIGPKDFVELIANAELVITTSFHGTAFAVNMGRPVYSIVDTQTGDDRQSAFLSGLDLNSRIIELNSPMPQSDFFNSGGINTNRLLKNKRKESIDYLLNSIE